MYYDENLITDFSVELDEFDLEDQVVEILSNTLDGDVDNDFMIAVKVDDITPKQKRKLRYEFKKIGLSMKLTDENIIDLEPETMYGMDGMNYTQDSSGRYVTIELTLINK